MKRLLKWVSAVLGLVVVGLIAGLVTVTVLIDPNQFKPFIISEFKKMTGFEVNIPGNLSWSLYPHLGMQADEVTIKDGSVFSAKLKHLVLRANFGPLLKRQLEFSKVSIAELEVNQLKLTKVESKVKFKDNTLALLPLTADLYQGSLHADATISLKDATPSWFIAAELKNADVAGLLQGLTGKTSKVQFDGLTDLSLNVTTQGKKTEELLSALSGTGRFAIGKGSLRGIDLAFFVDTATALINKEPLPTRTPNAKTEFGKITGTAIIKNGVVTTTDLLLDSPLYLAKGAGSVDLANKTVDYHLDVSSKTDLKTNKTLALYGKTVPVRVSGSLSDPSVTLDTLALMQELGKEQLQKVGQQIQKALPDKASHFLQNMFH